MYATEVDGQTLTLGVSGMLWEYSLVMIDQETKSLWSHLLGACMKGPLVGKELEVLPSLITDWESWQSRHAETSLAWLPRTTNDYRRKMSTPKEAFGIGLASGGESRLWGFESLHGAPVVNDDFKEQAVVVFYDSATRSASIFSSLVDGRRVRFMFDGKQCRDEKTKSVWDLLSGAAVSGPFKGRRLVRLPGIVTVKAAWKMFHPHGTFWPPTSEKP